MIATKISNYVSVNFDDWAERKVTIVDSFLEVARLFENEVLKVLVAKNEDRDTSALILICTDGSIFFFLSEKTSQDFKGLPGDHTGILTVAHTLDEFGLMESFIELNPESPEIVEFFTVLWDQHRGATTSEEAIDRLRALGASLHAKAAAEEEKEAEMLQ